MLPTNDHLNKSRTRDEVIVLDRDLSEAPTGALYLKLGEWSVETNARTHTFVCVCVCVCVGRVWVCGYVCVCVCVCVCWY